jgi:hypothetical protein
MQTNCAQCLSHRATSKKKGANMSAENQEQPDKENEVINQSEGSSIADLDTLLQAPLFFHRVFLQITGDIVSAWVLNEIFYWTRQRKEWFDCSLERWEKDYGVKRRAFKSAVAQLSRLGLLEAKKAGMPLRISYRINLGILCTEIRKVTRALQFVQNAKLA